jgi:hypothetical protein
VLDAYPEAERQQALRERREELDSAAEELQREGKRLARRKLACRFSLAGGYWAAATGDLITGLLINAAATLAKPPDQPEIDSAYSYLFSARNQYRRRGK